jgi:hypothetical protein
MTVIRRDGVTWVAARDGLAHADVRQAPRTLCGAIPTPDRFAWPIKDYCAVCLALERGLLAQRRGAASEQDRVAARAKADPAYRQMLMEDADLAAQQDAEGAA